MLVLSRAKDERIQIGNDIVISVVRIDTKSVRIGIEAPSDVPIRREELAEAIQRKESTPCG